MDVPGHERFVRNMVAAASGIDLVLLVVAADDGVMPQTREHLEIADLLGATTGLVALTKTDLVDEELLLFAEEDVRELLAGTFLADAPIVRVSSETGEGVEELRGLVRERLDSARPRADSGVFRVPVQRAFMRPGHGTVVTGVPLAGRVRVGDTLEVVPGGERVRVRALQAYHHEVQEARAGHRTALKLSDVSWREVRRGDVVAEPGYLAEANLLEARFHHLPRRQKPVVSNMPVRVHTGTSEVLGRVFLLDAKAIPPGEQGLVQLRLDRPLVSAPGDRYVLRTPSPQITLGGGRIIGASDRKISAGRSRLVRRVAERERTLDDVRSALRFHARASGLTPLSRSDLARAIVKRREELGPEIDALVGEGLLLVVGERLLSADEAERGRERLRTLLSRFHEREPLTPAAGRGWAREQLGVEDAVLEALVAGDPAIEPVAGGRLRLAAFRPDLSEEQTGRLEQLETILLDARFATPREDQLAEAVGATSAEAEKLLGLLLDAGKVVRLAAGVVMHADAVEEAKRVIAEFIRENGEIGPADLKNLVGMSRKYSIPLFEWLDARRFTMRKGDRRVLV
jgi:selenocysteine-specific elongation factor